jgi:DNA-binding NtrC family response regulator
LDSGKKTILVIEDDQNLRLAIEEQLSSLGYRVLTADGAESALQAVRSEKGKIDLALLDVILQGDNGLRVLKRLLEIQPNLKALFMSGYVSRDRALVDLGLDTYAVLAKPFSMAALARAVSENLGK